MSLLCTFQNTNFTQPFLESRTAVLLSWCTLGYGPPSDQQANQEAKQQRQFHADQGAAWTASYDHFEPGARRSGTSPRVSTALWKGRLKISCAVLSVVGVHKECIATNKFILFWARGASDPTSARSAERAGLVRFSTAIRTVDMLGCNYLPFRATECSTRRRTFGVAVGGSIWSATCLRGATWIAVRVQGGLGTAATIHSKVIAKSQATDGHDIFLDYSVSASTISCRIMSLNHKDLSAGHADQSSKCQAGHHRHFQEVLGITHRMSLEHTSKLEPKWVWSLLICHLLCDFENSGVL